MIDWVIKLIERVTKFGIETVFRRFYSNYRAQVTAIDDPKGLKRIKVKVPEIFEDKELATWAEPTTYAGASFGTAYPPKVGDWVWVWFEKGHPDFPHYSDRGWWGSGELPDDFSDKSYEIHGTVFRSGAKMIVNEKADKHFAQIRTKGGHIVFLDESADGNGVTIATKGGHLVSLSDVDTSMKFIAKGGAMIDLDKDGVAKIFDKGGATLTLNAKDNEAIFVHKDGHSLQLKKDEATLTHKDGKDMVQVMKDLVQVTSNKSFAVAAENMWINAGALTIGTFGIYSAVLGENLVAYNDTHFHLTGVGPSSPPVIPMASFTGSPLAITSLFIKLRSNII